MDSETIECKRSTYLDTARLDLARDAATPPPEAQVRGVMREVGRLEHGDAHLHWLAWLAIVVGSGYDRTQPGISVAVALGLALLMLARLAAHRGHDARVARHPGRARAVVRAMRLVHGAVWCGLGTVGLLWARFEPVQSPSMLAGAVIGATAVLSTATDPALRLLLCACALWPFALAAGLAPTPEHLSRLLIAGLMGAWLLRFAQRLQDDRCRSEAAWKRALEAVRSECHGLTDPLTLVHNRPTFERQLTQEWHQAARRSEPLTLILVELDGDDDLRARHGADVADQALVQVAIALEGSLSRSTDMVARHGGSQFAVLLPATEADAARGVAERLRRAVALRRVDVAAQELSLTCSFGLVTVWPAFCGSVDQVVDGATTARRQAQLQGGDCVVVAGEPRIARVDRLSGVVRRLRSVVETPR